MAKNDKEEPKKKKEKDPLEILLGGKQILITKKTRRGEFQIAFPLPSDLRRIELITAERLEGKLIGSFSDATMATIKVYATLDVAIVNAPKWWTKLSSSEECADDALITELYRSYLRHYTKTQKTLADGKFGHDVGKLELVDEVETLDDGAFSGITNR